MSVESPAHSASISALYATTTATAQVYYLLKLLFTIEVLLSAELASCALSRAAIILIIT